jgi:siroheme synthase (precorrin-2 oxidase/ferrochelatase)
VESIVADVEGKRVVVAGTADAAALKARIEAKTSKAVEVVSAGEKKADKDASPKEGKEKKQPPGETKPKEVGRHSGFNAAHAICPVSSLCY